MAAIEKNTSTTGRSRHDWQELDREHHLHPFTDYKDLNEKRSRIITRAEGCYIFDADGNRILDGMSGLWCVNVGYGRESIVEAAAAQMRELPYYNNFFQCAHPPSIELASMLTEVAQPQFGHVFFAGSGSESNDTIVRMIRRYWDLMEQPERRVIISRKNAYHGSTVAAATLGGMKPMHEQTVRMPDVVHIDQPYWYGSDQSLDESAFGLAIARQLEETINELGSERVAAFFAEPVQGAGGVIIPPDSYWPEIQRICDEYGVLLVSDEVITGFGRLGQWFGADYFETRPDFMPFAKGVTSGYLPLGGVMISDRVSDVLIERGGEFFHGYTYSGHPASCAVAIENLKILKRENLIDRVREDIGPYLASRWATLADHPLVGESRMAGLMGAFEIVKSKKPPTRFDEKIGAGKICRDHLVNNGAVMRAVGDSIICAPPFTLSHAEADELVEIAWRCLDLTQKDLAA